MRTSKTSSWVLVCVTLLIAGYGTAYVCTSSADDFGSLDEPGIVGRIRVFHFRGAEEFFAPLVYLESRALGYPVMTLLVIDGEFVVD